MKKPKRQAKAVSKGKPSPPKKPKAKLAKLRVPRVDGKKGRANDISWHERFLKALGLTGNIALACRVAGVSRNTAIEHKDKFDAFGDAWDEAEELGLDTTKHILMSDFINGVPRPVFQGGVEVGQIVERDNRVGMWLLERKRPAEFSAKHKVELSGSVRTMTTDEVVAAGQRAEEGILATMRRRARGKATD